MQEIEQEARYHDSNLIVLNNKEEALSNMPSRYLKLFPPR